MDAAIATLFCVGLMQPQSAGIGGGFLMTVYDQNTRTARCLNARETAPLAATEDMFNGNPESSQTGPLSVAVPGEVAGSWAAHQAYGKLPWSNLILPSADMADSGIVVTRALAEKLLGKQDVIKAEPSLR